MTTLCILDNFLRTKSCSKVVKFDNSVCHLAKPISEPSKKLKWSLGDLINIFYTPKHTSTPKTQF